MNQEDKEWILATVRSMPGHERMSKETEKAISSLMREITNMRENHLEHLREDVGDIKINVAKNSESIKWLTKAFWVVATGVVGGLIAQLYNLVT
jgi:hypothetical protein